MGRYILIRITSFFGVLLAVSLLTFILMHSVPGSPFDMMGGEKAVAIPPELMKGLNHLYGLDKPILEQYWIFLKNAVTLNFGYSYYWSTRTVTEIIRDHRRNPGDTLGDLSELVDRCLRPVHHRILHHHAHLRPGGAHAGGLQRLA
jgi:ABC-type microcin C transport system permease subunit YejB